MKIPITFLGTGQAIPTAKRNHTGILLSYKSENILVDCGEGIQRQFRIAKINPCSLTKILITHWHGDHVLGLPGLLQTLALNGYNKKLEVYVPKGTRRFSDLMFKLFVFRRKINYNINEVEGKFFENSDFILEAEKMEHETPCLAYSFTEKEKLRINKEKLKKLEKMKIKGNLIGELSRGKDIMLNGKKIKSEDATYRQESRKIAIILDTGMNPNCEKIAKNSDLLICESTFMENSENGKKLAKEYHHLTAKQAGEIAKKSKVKRLILTHLSQRYEGKEKKMLEEARKVFKNTEIAYDLMETEV